MSLSSRQASAGLCTGDVRGGGVRRVHCGSSDSIEAYKMRCMGPAGSGMRDGAGQKWYAQTGLSEIRLSGDRRSLTAQARGCAGGWRKGALPRASCAHAMRETLKAIGQSDRLAHESNRERGRPDAHDSQGGQRGCEMPLRRRSLASGIDESAVVGRGETGASLRRGQRIRSRAGAGRSNVRAPFHWMASS